ncbi:MAG: CARDB domain-containing protein [Thermoplasmatota archaeon]
MAFNRKRLSSTKLYKSKKIIVLSLPVMILFQIFFIGIVFSDPTLPSNISEQQDYPRQYQPENDFVQINGNRHINSFQWFDENWHYRNIFYINNKGEVSIPVNFSELLNRVNVSNKTFENNTILLIDYTSTEGTPVDEFNFDNLKGNFLWEGNLMWEASLQGYYAVYFDVEENEGERNDINQTKNINFSTTTNWDDIKVEGWWMQLNSQIKDYYFPSLDDPLYLNVSTMSIAKNVTAHFYKEGNIESSTQLQAITNTTWTMNRSFIDGDEGNWTLIISAYDNASYQPKNLTYDFLVAKPDLTVRNITFFSEVTGQGPFYEGYDVNIRAEVFVFNVTVHKVSVSMDIDNVRKQNKTIATLYKETKTTVEFTYKFEELGIYNVTVKIDPENKINESNINNNNFSRIINISASPDLGVKEIIIPQTSYNESDRVVVYAHITNTGNMNATNYQVNLYLEDNEEDEMYYRNTSKKNHTSISVNINETKNITLIWDSAEIGNWIVGVKILTNATKPDSNSLNNSKAVFTPRITVKGEDPPPDTDPVIQLLFPTALQEFERNYSVEIRARITDQVGIKNANISLITPNGTIYIDEMIKATNNVYIYKFEKTYLLGMYNFTITALDSSIYENIANLTSNFTIIEDATPPTIDFIDVLPKVQLPNKEVIISCIVSDPSGVSYVNVSIIHPDGFLKIYSMTKPPGSVKYYFNQTYKDYGKYTVYLIVEDSIGNRKSAEDKSIEFWITSDLNDTDNDGIPDWWEIKYGLDPYDPTDAHEDADGDGYTNLRKYQLGLNPREPVTISQRMTIQIQEHLLYFLASIAIVALLISFCIYGIRRKNL